MREKKSATTRMFPGLSAHLIGVGVTPRRTSSRPCRLCLGTLRSKCVQAPRPTKRGGGTALVPKAEESNATLIGCCLFGRRPLHSGHRMWYARALHPEHHGALSIEYSMSSVDCQRRVVFLDYKKRGISNPDSERSILGAHRSCSGACRCSRFPRKTPSLMRPEQNVKAHWSSRGTSHAQLRSAPLAVGKTTAASVTRVSSPCDGVGW